jgi:hypothetical protein
MDTLALPAATEVSLLSGPSHGKKVSIYGRPYELWIPNDDPQVLPLCISPMPYYRRAQWVAIYIRVVGKNQYKFLEMRQI